MTKKEANLLLVTVSMAWGTSYMFMKFVADLPLLTIAALRCGIAFFVMAGIFYARILRVNSRTLLYSAITGALLCGVFIGLLYGVQATSASNAGFYTSITVVFVPILQAVLTRKMPEKNTLLGVAVVLAGLFLLTGGTEMKFERGAIYCLFAAFLYAWDIILTGRFVKIVDSIQLGICQLGFASLYATIAAFLLETPVLPQTSLAWGSVLGLALLCSAYGFIIQPMAQQYTTPECTGFAFSLEPVFSAFFAFFFLQEDMGTLGYLGAGLIMAGVCIANFTGKKIAEDVCCPTES